MPLKKIYVLLGNFGSGKTELALNFAFCAAKKGKTLLVDIDMVNTYFRLSERKNLIDNAGIKLISPNYASKNIETLSLPGEVSSAFHTDWDTVIFDGGGDPAGARALGRFYEEFARLSPSQLEVLNVVNLRRPLSGTPDKIIELMHSMSDSSRLPVTGLVNNTNLAHLTTPAELCEGCSALSEVSRRTGIPVLYTSGKQDVLNAFLAGNPKAELIGTPFELNIYMHRDWETFTKQGI